MACALTIVIPYFKPDFFEKTLQSLANQSHCKFELFIGDDCSPADPSLIINRFRDRLEIVYKRYEDNLGNQSPVLHWNRCIRETKSPWVWLFADDDMMSPECVSSFYAEIADDSDRLDVYRFQTHVVDIQDRLIRVCRAHPKLETDQDVAVCRILHDREFYIQDHIFSRRAFDREGGVVQTPCGLFSEDLTWSAFASQTGARTIEQGTVYWRQSGTNLNSANPKLVARKFQACMQYLETVERRYDFSDPEFRSKLYAAWITFMQNAVPHFGGMPRGFDKLKFFYFLMKRWGLRSTAIYKDIGKYRKYGRHS